MTTHVGVFGAGAIGGYLGILLSSAGLRVTLLGREDLAEAVRDGMVVEPIGGPAVRPGPDLTATTDPRDLAGCDVCLVTVKSGQTEEAARTLKDIARDDAVIVSFQNGLRNAGRLRAQLAQRVVAGMVSFNVYRQGGHFHQATRGPLVAGRPDPVPPAMKDMRAAFEAAGEPLELRSDIDDVLAGKLLLNLNNGVCAASGVSIANSLRDRDLRWVFGRCMSEGLAVLRAAGRRPATLVGVPPGLIARLLGLPNFIVLRVAKKMVAVDPGARSSTLQDLDRGRMTEIDELNGEIVRIAGEAGLQAPANALITDLVHAHEQAQRPIAFPSATELRARVASAG